jgi:hypothetical protein
MMGRIAQEVAPMVEIDPFKFVLAVFMPRRRKGRPPAARG